MSQTLPALPGDGPPDRERGGRSRLSVEVVVDHAMELARTEGLPGISMRRVAASAGVEPMSLYHYVPSKAALMVLMADRSAARALSAADQHGPWDQQLLALLMAVYHAGADNPALLEVLAAQPLRAEDLPAARPGAGDLLTDLLDRILDVLDQARLPAADLAHTFRGLIGIVAGFLVAQVDGLSTPPGQPTRHAQPSRLAAVQPILQATSPAEGVYYSLKVFLRGITPPQ